MAKNYSYPRVTMSTYAKKHSHKVVTVPDTTIMFAHEKIKKELSTNREISTALREIKQALKLL